MTPFLILFGIPLIMASIMIIWRVRAADVPEIRALSLDAREIEGRASFLGRGTPEERRVVRAHAPGFFLMVRLTELVFLVCVVAAVVLIIRTSIG